MAREKKSTFIRAVMHFCRCSDGSTLASGRIAKFLSTELDCILIDEKRTASGAVAFNLPYDELYVVNSPFGFCDWREQAVLIAQKAKKVFWIQNDYAIKPPSQFTKAQIQFTDILTTVPTQGTYIDWNRLTYTPVPNAKNDIAGVFYHGAFRAGREDCFGKYLLSTAYNITVSSTVNGLKKFADFASESGSLNAIRYLGPVTLKQMSRFQTGLYIEDKKSHSEFHSLANRFYEYLSAGLAIAIDKDCAVTFEKSGLRGWEAFVVNDSDELEVFCANWFTHAKSQKKLWTRDYIQDLRDDLARVV